MRNLPQTVGSLRQDGVSNESSSFEAICPGEWPLSSSPDKDRSELSSPNIPNSKYDQHARFTPTKGEYVCTYIVEHRVRLLFSLISLIFLGIFFLVIYRRFSFLVFIISLVVITVPLIGALIYARRLKIRESQKQQEKALARAASIRQRKLATMVMTASTSNVDIQSTPSPTPIFTTDESARQLHSIRKGETIAWKHSNHQHKITIQLPPSMIESV